MNKVSTRKPRLSYVCTDMVANCASLCSILNYAYLCHKWPKNAKKQRPKWPSLLQMAPNSTNKDDSSRFLRGFNDNILCCVRQVQLPLTGVVWQFDKGVPSAGILAPLQQ